jgi:hypothetical protein
MAKEMADNSVVAISTSDSEGEDENDPFYHPLYGFSSLLIDFIAQNTILIELAIQISVSAHIIRYDGKIRNIPLQIFDLQ